MPTEYYRKQLIRHEFRAGQTEGHGPRRGHAVVPPRQARRRLLPTLRLGRSFKFLYVGRLSREKNLDLLLQAFDRLLQAGRPVSLVFVGDGPYREELQRSVGPPDRLHRLPREGEELAAAYASADAMVFPSTTDTFGNVVLEAQAWGLPVIVTDRGGPPDIVRRYNSGIVFDVSRPETLLDAIAELSSNPKRCDELRASGLRNAEECSWQRVLEDLWGREEESNDHEETPFDDSISSQLAPGVISMELA